MSSSFLASRTLAKMNRLEGQLRTFAHHARTLRNLHSGAVDARDLLGLSNRLIRGLIEVAEEFGDAKLRGRSIRRGLPSRPPKSSGVGRYQYSGPPPAAAWGSEFAAAEKRFRRALTAAKTEVFKLQHAAVTGMNKPNRTGSEPTAIFDAIMAFVEILTAWVESRDKD